MMRAPNDLLIRWLLIFTFLLLFWTGRHIPGQLIDVAQSLKTPGAQAILIVQSVPASVDVRSFGAAADDEIEDTGPIQAALNSGAAEVRIPAGQFIVRNLVLPSNIRIVGEPGKSVLKLKATATDRLILSSLYKKSNVTIEHLAFVGIRSPTAVCLELVDMDDTRIADCEFNGNYGIHLLGSMNRIMVERSKFTGNYGIVTEDSSHTAHIEIQQCEFRQLTGDGVALNCPTGTARNWTIHNNVFDTLGANTVAGFGVSLSGNYIDGVNIRENDFYRCDHQAIHVEDGTRHVKIFRNRIRDTGRGSSQSYRAGIYIAATQPGREISNVTIAHNTIEGGDDMQYGIYCGGSITTELVHVLHNTVTAATVNGLYFSSVFRHLYVDNNTVTNSAGAGIRASGRNARYSGNVCFDTRQTKTQTYGISTNIGTDVIYTGNILRDNLRGAFDTVEPDTRAQFIANVGTEGGTH